MTYNLAQDERIDWWQVLEDLRKLGLSIESIAEHVGISKGALMGWRNLDVEPKHSDGNRLLDLWRARLSPPVPVTKARARYNAPGRA